MRSAERPATSTGISVVELHPSRRADRARFLRIAAPLYRGDPCYVPPLRMEQRKLLDPRRNPWFRHADLSLFVATRGRDDVGRVAAIWDRRHVEAWGESVGFFGFFESIDDRGCATRLLEAAESWVKARGAVRVRGPVNPSMHDECGCLVSGFDSPPVLQMPYNPPTYPSLLEACGYVKDRDLLAYEFSSSQELRPAVARISRSLEESGTVRVREVDFRRFDQEMQIIWRIYNSAWEKNWGFVPLDREEFEWKAASMRSIADRRFALIVEVRDGESYRPAAFGLALPDLNEILIRLSGRLTPLAIVRLFLGMRRIQTVRLLMLGVLPEFRRRGLESLLLRDLHARAARAGIPRGDLSWVLEDNEVMNRTIVKAGGRLYKTYRIFGKPLV